VTLMTLHTAKGLEWPLVVLSGMEDGLFPLGRALESPEGLDEERRLCYVGITRARDVLLLTWTRARRRGGELRPAAPSRFLRELPPELVDEQRTSFGAGAPGLGGAGGNWGGWRQDRSRRTPATTGGRPPVTVPREVEEAFVAQEDNQDAPRYVKGERVRHRRFGAGAILGLSGAGKDLKVSVGFDDPEIGTKQLLVAFAGLERDWDSA
jgi:DNA helicase-2/ATP-dependent DNA helicase PcrA